MTPARTSASILLSAAILSATAGAASPGADDPGTVTYAWTIPMTEAPGGRVHLRKFRTRGGLIKTVRVRVAGKAVPGPPNIAVIGCLGARRATTAQKSWLWDGRHIYVSLLLQPGSCSAAGRSIHAYVVLRTVGT